MALPLFVLVQSMHLLPLVPLQIDSFWPSTRPWTRPSTQLPECYFSTCLQKYHVCCCACWPVTATMQINMINLTFAQHLFRSIHKDYTPRTHHTQLNPYPNTIGHAALIRPAACYEPDTVEDRDITSATHPSPSFMTDP
jgi:hypothetical protein